ncbi:MULTISPECIES: hypothetical protein [unclassified Methylophaga]|jgi:hypothetical protein|uniref:hypothetical protein n=2 Tax=unclassified Methylophaga TaxID=2629249 RepID=UPI00259CB467|nr:MULTISPECIES: hypothetical protein [unclassified Methylophaga]|tara:strand:- start:38656 stop:40056 length:1401 start_codon:yes stop_codon:yes gene_type:complete
MILLMKMQTQLNDSMPGSAAELISVALDSGDIYSAAAVYGLADIDDKKSLAKLLTAKRRDVLKLARWEHTPTEVLALFADVEDEAVRLRIDKNPATQTQTLSNLYRDEADISFITLIAKHANTSAEVLWQILHSSTATDLVRAVVKNPNTDAETLALVAEKFADQFDAELASHPATSADLLMRLYARGNEFVQAAVVAHKACPDTLFTLAAKQESSLILRHLATNPHIDKRLTSRLALDKGYSVRRAAASHKNLPAWVLEQLVRDDSEYVRRVVAAREDLTAEMMNCLIADTDHWVRQWVALNPKLSDSQLYSLSQDEHKEVRRAVARNPKTNSALLRQLANDEQVWVRAAVANQPNTPASTLIILADMDDIDVLGGVASNPKTPQKVLQRLSYSISADVRRAVILNKMAIRQTLLPLLDDPYYLNRMMLIQSRALSADDKWTLYDDPDPAVRFSLFTWFSRQYQQ